MKIFPENISNIHQNSNGRGYLSGKGHSIAYGNEYISRNGWGYGNGYSSGDGHDCYFHSLIQYW